MSDLKIEYDSSKASTFQINIYSGNPSGIIYTGSLTVNWGDGTVTTETSSTFSHTYSSTGIYTITMSGNITGLGASSLTYLYGIKSIIIPDSVTIIYNGWLYMRNISDSLLSSITFESSTPPSASSNTFKNVPACTIYVPQGSLSTYTSAQYYPSSSTYNYVEYSLSHDYAIEFGESSYETCDGSCTVSATLTDDNIAVSGETVSLTGTGSTLTATTDSNGVATFNLSSISEDKTLTVTFDEVSDTATLTYGLATLNGSLTCLGKRMASNLTSKGVTGVDYTDGLTSLADEILNIATLDDYEEVELLITYTDTSTETITVLKEKTTS